MKEFLLRADDLGYSEAVNYGIEKTVREGLIRSVGLMPNMEAAAHGVSLLAGCNLALGQHTNISVGKPLSDPEKIPSLIGADGNFKKSGMYAAAGEDIVAVEEAELEIEAQYEKFVELTGRQPDYFEGHAVFSKNFFLALERVADRHHLKYSGFSFDGNPITVGSHQVRCAMPKSMEEGYDPTAQLKELVEGADEACVTLCVFHPGYLDAYLLGHSSLTVNRTKEVETLCDRGLKDWLGQKAVTLLDYRDL